MKTAKILSIVMYASLGICILSPLFFGFPLNSLEAVFTVCFALLFFMLPVTFITMYILDKWEDRKRKNETNN